MTSEPFRDAVSELTWAGRRRGYRDPYLSIAVAHRVGEDEWVIMPGHSSVPSFLRRDRKWGNVRAIARATRWTTAEVLDVCPRVVAHELSTRWGLAPEDQELWCGWWRPPADEEGS